MHVFAQLKHLSLAKVSKGFGPRAQSQIIGQLVYFSLTPAPRATALSWTQMQKPLERFDLLSLIIDLSQRSGNSTLLMRRSLALINWITLLGLKRGTTDPML